MGFGLELALETQGTELPLDAIEASWPYILLERVSKELVAHEQVRERARAGLVVLEVAGRGLPASLVTTEERVGVLLGQESRSLPRQFPTPFGDVRLVTVKALLPAELEYASKRGAQGAAGLARRFVDNGEEHVSRAKRTSLLDVQKHATFTHLTSGRPEVRSRHVARGEQEGGRPPESSALACSCPQGAGESVLEIPVFDS